MAFSVVALTKMYSSNFFCPSNYVQREIEDLGSIKDSLTNNPVDLFERVPIPRTCAETFKRGMRCLARFIVALFIYIVLAPLGFVYHLALATAHLIPAILPSKRVVHLRKSSEHGENCMVDYVVSATTLFFCMPAFYAAFNLGYLLSGPYNRAPFCTAFILKNEFGITGKDGRLLRWNTRKDGDLGFFVAAKGVQDMLLLTKIHEIQTIARRTLDIQYPPTPESVQTALNFEHESVPKWRQELQRLGENIKEIERLRSVALSMKNRIPLPYFTRSEEFSKKIYAGQTPPWVITTATIRELYNRRKSELPPNFLKYLRRILAFQGCDQILGVPTIYYAETLKKALKDAKFACHPDKNPDHYDLATATFSFIQLNYEVLRGTVSPTPTVPLALEYVPDA